MTVSEIERNTENLRSLVKSIHLVNDVLSDKDFTTTLSWTDLDDLLSANQHLERVGFKLAGLLGCDVDTLKRSIRYPDPSTQSSLFSGESDV